MVETRSAVKLANGVGAASSSSSNSSTTNTNGGTKLVDRKSQKTEQTHEPRKMPPTSSRKVNVEGSSNNAINGDIKHSGLSTTKTGNRHQPAVPVAVIGAANNKRSYGTHDDEDDRKMPAKATQSIAANVGINLFSDNEGENNDQESVIAIPSEDDDDSVVLVHPYRHFATKEEQEMTDAKLAASLQSAETKARDHRKQQELDFMKKSHAGRAVLLVEKVIALLLKPEYVKEGIEPLGRDDAVFLAEQLFAMQAELQQKKISSKKSQKDDSAPPKGARKSNKKKAIAPNTKEIPTHVSIGYHYTSQVNLDSIRTDGLLTIEDRQAATHTNMRNIAYFGNGIYTGTSKLMSVSQIRRRS
ncbi:unknown protein [Seminavis robusta]|uniref:Uncharacterized protein n=1 Tax=Seminavis robusta TaxID=568900 RepID=A0A9N8ER12_9STRA|nr:unknown protein [Seminavis robusta]|eukprot:Sro1428_g271900.1 n/a (358) ;mRNA; f:26789-27862